MSLIKKKKDTYPTIYAILIRSTEDACVENNGELQKCDEEF